MSSPIAKTSRELDELDRIYREGGLRTMSSPHVHYQEPLCPHANCGHSMEWIDFQLELFGDRDGIYVPLVKAWWEGTGFAGRCPLCQHWIRFTTMKMESLTDDHAASYHQLPDNWHTIAQFA